MITKFGIMRFGAVQCTAYAFLTTTAFAQFIAPVPGPDASDIWMRNQIMNLGSGINVAPVTSTATTSSSGSAGNGTLSGDQSFEIQKAAFEAIDEGEWETALNKMVEYLNATMNSSLETDLNRASNYLTAFMLSWNIDSVSKAKEFLEKSIKLMRTGEHLGGGCEVRAVKFQEKMKNGELPTEFTAMDIQSDGGIHEYIMALPNAKFKNNIAALCARYEAIGGMADSWKGVYEAESRYNERMAKQEARDAYRKSTGETFSPTNPPDSDSPDRKHWDAAKRIYDIFGK